MEINSRSYLCFLGDSVSPGLGVDLGQPEDFWLPEVFLAFPKRRADYYNPHLPITWSSFPLECSSGYFKVQRSRAEIKANADQGSSTKVQLLELQGLSLSLDSLTRENLCCGPQCSEMLQWKPISWRFILNFFNAMYMTFPISQRTRFQFLPF